MQFSKDYQKELLLKMARKGFMAEIGKHLSVEMFDPALESVVERILKLWDKSKTTLTTGQIR